MRFYFPALVALALLVHATPAHSQGRDTPGDERSGGSFGLDTGTPFSAEGHGVAGAGLFAPTEDPVRMLENPAFLGDVGDEVRLSGSLTNGLNGIDGFDLRSGALAGGIQRRLAGHALTLAVGLSVSDLPSGFDESTNRVVALGVGAGWDGPVRVRAGLGGRRLSSSSPFLSSPDVTEVGTVEASALAADLGADVTLPVGRWVQPDWASGPRLAFDVTAGVTRRGFTIRSSSRVTSGPGEVSLPEVSADRSLAYGGRVLLGLGHGTPSRPLLVASVEGVADNARLSGSDVELRGARLAILETLTLSVGSLEGGTFLPRSTVGLGLSVGGLLRAVGALTDDGRLFDLGEQYDLRLDIADQSFDGDELGFFGDARTVGFVLRVRP